MKINISNFIKALSISILVILSGCCPTGRKQKSYDLVVSDYKLPGMDGLEFFEHIRVTHPRAAKILITAYGSPALFSLAKQIGAAGCIEKPITAEKVETCLALVDRTWALPT